MSVSHVKQRKTQCSRCDGEAIPGQGYCRICRAFYMRRWRKKRRAELLALRRLALAAMCKRLGA